MTGNLVREHLRNGKRVYGTHVYSVGNPVALALTADLEFDFVFFCSEHVPLGRTETSMLCQYFRARGISPIVRVPDANPTAIAMALDGGAEGIVVPYVETIEEVRRASGAVKCRPVKGALLRQVMAGERELPGRTAAFVKEFNRDRYLIIGIESMAAIEQLETLITAAEVDGVFLGPHDITATMGIPTEYRNPEFIALLENVVRCCRKHGVGVGVHTALLKLEEAHLLRLLAAGMNWILNASDMTVMRDAMRSQLATLRALGAEAVATSEQPRPKPPSAPGCLG